MAPLQVRAPHHRPADPLLLLPQQHSAAQSLLQAAHGILWHHGRISEPVLLVLALLRSQLVLC